MSWHTITKLEVYIRNLQWRPDWRIWILVLCFLPLLIWLGIWQLGRAEEKTLQRARWETLEAVEWPLPGKAIEGQPVIIEGRYLPERQWLLDNRTRDGRVGYEVLTLFRPDSDPALVRPESGPALVINRGWIAGPRQRNQLPEVNVTGDRVKLLARVSDWPSPPVVGSVEREASWPKRVQALTPEIAVETSRQAVSDVFLRLADSQQPGALQADWAPSRMGVDTHYGYAAQWFGLAIALTVLSIVASFRKSRSTEEPND